MAGSFAADVRWFPGDAREASSPLRGLSPMRRGAKSRAVADLPIGARREPQHHRCE